MTTQHTPGPWHWEFHREDGWCLTAEDGSVVEYATPPSRSLSHPSDANGFLIAAAPYMLEALKTIANAPVGMVVSIYRDIARAAIAKARG